MIWWAVALAFALGPLTLFGLRATIHVMGSKQIGPVVALWWVVGSMVSFGVGLGIAIRNLFM